MFIDEILLYVLLILYIVKIINMIRYLQIIDASNNTFFKDYVALAVTDKRFITFFARKLIAIVYRKWEHY